MILPNKVVAELASQLAVVAWDVARVTAEAGGQAAAMRACNDLHAVDRELTLHGHAGYEALFAAGRASGALDDYAREITKARSVDDFHARLWRELTDAAEDLRAILDDDREVNPDDVCRDPQAHLDYLQVAVQVSSELVEQWRALVEDHAPAEALRLALEGGEG